MKTTRRILGVDLGTTWTAAAFDGEVLPLANHGAAMPSVVAVDGGAIVVGEAAERRLLADPTCGVREMKRRLGDTTPMVIGGTPFGAEALMGHLLAHVVAVATERHGGAPGQVVLTHPANWGEYKLDLLREAARVAGVDGVQLISEPEAAALHYVRLGRLHEGDTVAVYEFGGGTFDAAVVRCTAGGAELLGQAEGLERLGGIDIDQVVVAHVNEALDGQLAELDGADPDVRRALARLRADCTTAKEALSADGEVAISVVLPSLSTTVRLTRGELEGALRPRLADTLASLDRAVRSAGVTFEQLAGVVLVGGSSRIPLVAEEVARHTGRPVLVDADPKLVVCMGATQPDPIVPSGAEAVPSAAVPDAPGAQAGPQAAPGTPPPPPPTGSRIAANTAQAAEAQRKRSSTAGTVGAVAAGVAATAGLVAGGIAVSRALDDDGDGDDSAWGGLFGGDEGSMDAFDAEAPAEPELQGLFGAVPESGLTAMPDEPVVTMAAPPAPPVEAPPSAPQFRPAPPRPQAAEGRPAVHHDEPQARPAPRPEPQDRPEAAPVDTGRLDDVKQTLADRLAGWNPPEGADPAEVAELRAELAALIDRHQVVPGQSVEQAIDALQDEFGQRVQDFVQDTKLDALIEDRDGHGSDDETTTGDESTMPADGETMPADGDTDASTDDEATDGDAGMPGEHDDDMAMPDGEGATGDTGGKPAGSGIELVDEFDAMMDAEATMAGGGAAGDEAPADSGDAATMPAGDVAGIAIGELDPSLPVPGGTFDDVLGDQSWEAEMAEAGTEAATDAPVQDMFPDPRVTMPAFEPPADDLDDVYSIEVEPQADDLPLAEVEPPSVDTTWTDDDDGPSLDDAAPLYDPNAP